VDRGDRSQNPGCHSAVGILDVAVGHGFELRLCWHQLLPTVITSALPPVFLSLGSTS
jgi:hypothetical protein